MKFPVVEKVNPGMTAGKPLEFADEAHKDLRYKMDLKKKGKIVGGGPFLDVVGDCYILETKTLEEMGKILFSSPSNIHVEREVHPLGSFEDSYEGMAELLGKRHTK